MIEYGADHLKVNNLDNNTDNGYSSINKKYAIVCRIEPENNIHIILEAFAKIKTLEIVIVGNWKNSKYGIDCYNKYKNYNNITMLDPIYDNKKEITSLERMLFYIFTVILQNPSLVEAMYLGLPVLAYDCVYNRDHRK